MTEPRELVERLEANAELPSGEGERFSGYGVMACPFASGDILCHRRFPASSIGPAYTSIWHRDPQGEWRFYQDVPPLQACPRFFGSALTEATQVEVDLTWTGARQFHIAIPNKLEWQVSLAPSAATRAMNALGSLLPDRLWRSPAVLRVMTSIAGPALGAGKLAMAGAAPNGQHFVANPLLIWTIPESHATIDGRDLGSVQPLPSQPKLGDFWIPRSALFVIGRAFFDTFDPARHLAVASKLRVETLS
jgi:hypothetical protein